MTSAPAPLPRRRFVGRLFAAAVASSGLGRLFAGRAAQAAPQVDDTPYFGEIRMFAGDFAPSGWMLCEGQFLQIADYEALYQLIGTTYGGDGQQTFALPDLRGRVPVHQGNGFVLAEGYGTESVTLTPGQIPAHTHAAMGSGASGASDDPSGRVPARNAAGVPVYAAASNTELAAAALLASGGSSPHTNMQPYLGIHFIISLAGIFPSQT